MAEDKDKKAPAVAGEEEDASIEKLLADRQKLDQQLKEKFSQDVTVMFTDIKGSTSFFETYGDIEGRLMVQKHNEMLFPLVEKHAGRVIKTIGDAIMAAYDGPEQAVRSAIDMQAALQGYNSECKEQREQIHVRIGINTGEGLVEKKDIFGDVVNVAARVESLTDPDEIMVSGPVYDEVRRTDDIICRYADQTKVKGKEEPIDVYRVIWGEEEAMTGVTRGTPAIRAGEKRRRNRKRLEIDISRDGDILKITSSEKSDKGQSTIRPYEEMKISMPDVEARCREITDLLNRANTRGKVSKDILIKLRDVGHVLFDALLTAQAKEILRGAGVDDLLFHIEDSLVQIPWELLYDGEQFLCQKFNMGRLVKTRHSVVNIKQRPLSRPLKMLIISDPRGDLENSSLEGQSIREELDKNPSFISANQRSGQIRQSYVVEKIRNYDLVHYAGHADYDTEDPSNSGWLLEGGKFTSADVMKLVGGRPMPAMVFCNACHSGQTEEWKIGASYNQQIFGLANAFLLSGVRHYIGTFWEILDEPGARFAEEFYRAMLQGAPPGEAVRQARLFLIKEYGEDTIVWASYMLYGDPGVDYFEFAREEEADGEASADTRPELKEAARVRSAPSDSVRFNGASGKTGAGKKWLALAAALVLVVLAAVFFTDRAAESDPALQAYARLQAGQLEEARLGFEALAPDDPRRLEGLAAVLYEAGDMEAARETAQKALAQAPDSLYARVVLAQGLLLQGKLDEALSEFETAAGQKSTIKWQRAQAYNGIARIHSSRGDTAKSAEYYARAAALNPYSSVIFSNQAFAMQRMGDASGALGAFQKAAQSNPGDPLAAVMLADALKKKKDEADQARRDRVDKLVDDLAAAFKAGEVPPPHEDAWTSRPLTISFLSFSSKGAPAEREGEEEFFLLQMSAQLQESGRAQIVERQLLDKLLEELKLSSTDLVNRSTALQLGRVLAARVLATGSIMRYNGDIQVSVRLTDSETTALKGAVTASGRDLNSLAEDVSAKIAAKLQKGYPVQGRVAAVEDGRVVLNVGREAGVQEGMVLKVLDPVESGTGRRVRHQPIGTATVASADQSAAEADFDGQPERLKVGLLVQQVLP